METRNKRRTVGRLSLIWALAVIVLSVLGCGSSTGAQSETVTEPLVVQQVNVMRDLRTWGAENVQLAWSDAKVSVRNDGDAVLFCGVTSTEKSYQPDHYFGIRRHGARDIDVPISPFLRCVVQWDDAARIVGRDERELAAMFDETSLDGTPPSETSHGASLVFMPDPMPNLGVQIDDRYTLLD